MAHGPEDLPLEEELGELAKAMFKLPPDAVDTSDLEDSDEASH